MSVTPPKPTPLDVQNEFYENMSDVNWTRFTKADYKYLKRKVAYALFGPPMAVGDMAHLTETLEGYNTRQQDAINEIYNLIISHAKCSLNKEDILLSVVFVVCMEPIKEAWHHRVRIPDSAWENLERNRNVVMWTVPVFAIRRCHPIDYIPGKEPCRVFIDNEGRVYDSWSAYLTQNNLSKCHMLLPDDGTYKIKNDEPDFSVMPSPAFKFSSRALKVADVGGTVVSIGSAVAAVAGGPAVVVGALVAGAVTGVYGIVRSSFTLKNRADHSQSINIANPEARGCYLNIGMSTVGIAASASTKVLQKVAAAGSGATKVGVALQHTVDVFRIANFGLSGIGLFNGLGTCIYKWAKHNEKPSPLECFQLATSILFFANAVVSNRTASQIVSEAEAQTINDYRSSLRSNRHRKIFDKMVKETKRTNGNIIKGITRIDDKDNFFASVVKMNKEMNKNGVKISFSSDGRAQLNGLRSVDPAEMYNMGPDGRYNMYTKLGSAAPTSTARSYTTTPNQASASGVNATTSLVSNVPNVLMQIFTVDNLQNTVEIGYFIFRMSDFDDCIEKLSQLLSNYSGMIYDALIRLVLDMIENLVGDACEMLGVFSNSEKISLTLKFVLNFIRSQTMGHMSPHEIDNNFVLFLKQIFMKGFADADVIQVMLMEFYTWIKKLFTARKIELKLGDCPHCGYLRYNI